MRDICPEAILGEVIFRHHGPNLAEAALAHDRVHYPVDSLRYIYIAETINNQTRPFVVQLYIQQGIHMDVHDSRQSGPIMRIYINFI
jgi:hypothetical protein